MTPPRVAGLYVYPVKSCRGIAVDRAGFDALGVVGDRRFLVIDEHDRFLTQRDTPRLALVGAEVHDGTLTLTARGHEPLTLSIDPPDPVVRQVTVWRDTVRARDLGDRAAAWLSEILQRPARCVGLGPEFDRPIRKPIAQPGDVVAFTDAFPLLLLGEASLADLNARLDAPLPMNRFRPNLVVRDAPAYAEDLWTRIRIGGMILRRAKPCGRCVITTTDQVTLERSPEPLRTLARYRRGTDGEVYFGSNYIHETKSGTIAVGDLIEVLE